MTHPFSLIDMEDHDSKRKRWLIKQIGLWLLFTFGNECVFVLFISGNHSPLAKLLWWIWTFPVFEILVYVSLPENVALGLWVLQDMLMGFFWWLLYAKCSKWLQRKR
jgi:hypothetical protein